MIKRWQPYKRRFNVTFKRSTIKSYIHSQQNNVYNKSKARHLNPRYWEFSLHLSEEIRWMWNNGRLKFYPKKSIRTMNIRRKLNDAVPISVIRLNQIRAGTVYSEDLI